MSAIGLDDLNNSNVVPLHIIDGNISSEEGISHIYITEAAIPLFIGTEKGVPIEDQAIPAQVKTLAAEYSHFNLSHTNQHVAYHAQPKKTLSLPKTKQTPRPNQTKYIEVIPNSSKRYAINKQIELIPPLNHPSISLLKQNEHHKRYSQNLDTNPITSLKEQPTLNLSNLINETDIKYLLKQQLGAPLPNNLELENNSQAFKPQTKEESEILAKNTDQCKTTVRKPKVQNYIHISDQRVPQRAIAVLPSTLQIRGTDYIFSRRTLPARIRFGPVEGIKKIVNQSQAHSLLVKKDSPVFLLKKDNEIIHIDVTDRDKCNWMGLLPVGVREGEANVWLYQEEDELFAMTTEPISARKPLKLGFSKRYAENHILPPGLPTLDLDTVLSSNPKQWWCNECNRALPSATILQRHSELFHKDDVISTRRGYRCQTCRRTFSRLFTLRRHISKHCPKKTEKPPPKADVSNLNTSIDLNSTLINEENRIPSDESFQNFTNGLDFTSSLFDTDRMSNIDISANSRADDFNPYDIAFRDDTCTSNDLSFSKLTGGASHIISEREVKNNSPSHKCSYCNQIVRKGNRRKHKSECPLKKMECTCGKIFRNKEKLVQHFLEDHPTDSPQKSNIKSDKYTCELCKPKRLSFKRRGMLVNHLWRAHKTVSTTKVERPVKHYPCVACPKIYRSAAKRDHHVKIHHPGAEKLRAQSIESGVRAYEPAACEKCPRQYATRAKLLQHVRKHHPLAAHEITKENKAKSQPITDMEKQHCVTTKYLPTLVNQY